MECSEIRVKMSHQDTVLEKMVDTPNFLIYVLVCTAQTPFARKKVSTSFKSPNIQFFGAPRTEGYASIQSPYTPLIDGGGFV